MIKKLLNRLKKFIFPITRKKVIILIIAALLATGGLIATQRSMQSQPLQFTAVKKQDVKSIVSASGILNGKNTTDLKFRSSGKLAYVSVSVGEKVTTGQNIAGLDTEDLNIKLQQAQNTLADREAALAKTLDDIHLFQYGNGGFGNVNSANETQTQRATRISAQTAVNNAFDSLREAELAFQDTSITAPYSGVITQVKVVAGQSVSGADVIATISDNSTTYFDAEVDQADISKVTLGQQATINLDSFPDRVFKGTVAEIEGQTKTTGNNATVILVRIKFSDNPNTFISGLTGQVSIIIDESKDTLSVPLEALRENDTVLVETSGRIISQKVTVGVKSDTEVEIKSGLTEQERIVLNPPANFNTRFQNQNSLFRFIRLPR